MSTRTKTSPARKALELFNNICREADELSVDEGLNALPQDLDREAIARRWQDAARLARSHLHSAGTTKQQVNKAQALCLMLTEISRAETPELVSERFHARREELEAGLQELV